MTHGILHKAPWPYDQVFQQIKDDFPCVHVDGTFYGPFGNHSVVLTWAIHS